MKTQFVATTVKDNMEGYTKREVKGAKLARKLHQSLGCPTVDTLKQLIRMNAIKNCPVTTEDITNAENMFGPDVGALKGKSTRNTPPPVINDLIDIPPELKTRNNLTLCMDIMFVWGLPFLTTIDRTIRFRAAVPLKNRTSKEIYAALDMVLRHYTKAEYIISDIHCDQEFRSMMDAVSDELDVEMNYTTTNEHVPARVLENTWMT